MVTCVHCKAVRPKGVAEVSPLPAPSTEDLLAARRIPSWADAWSDDMIDAASMPKELQNALWRGVPFGKGPRTKSFELR